MSEIYTFPYQNHSIEIAMRLNGDRFDVSVRIEPIPRAGANDAGASHAWMMSENGLPKDIREAALSRAMRIVDGMTRGSRTDVA
jgi:hypothetical protein